MNTPTNTAKPETVTLQTDDGYAITALRYSATAPLRGNLVVAGATGVPQRFYQNFANFAASTLRGFRMHYLDWARQDLRAAVDAMAGDAVPLFMIGHSFGGHAFGLLPNHRRVARFYTFATGAGWHGWMPAAEQLKVQLMWRVIGPLLTRWKGYLPWSKLGMGEDLPLGVYQDWKHWCSYPRYFFDDPSMGVQVQDLFDGVTTPTSPALPA